MLQWLWLLLVWRMWLLRLLSHWLLLLLLLLLLWLWLRLRLLAIRGFGSGWLCRPCRSLPLLLLLSSVLLVLLLLLLLLVFELLLEHAWSLLLPLP